MLQPTRHKNIFWLLALLGLILFVVGFRSTFISEKPTSSIIITGENEKYFAIAPHFTIQPKTISKFYTFLQDTYKIDKNDLVNIVLISPDHFDATDKNIIQFCSPKICFQGTCLPAGASLPGVPCIQTGNISEHGIGAAFSFISKTFPQATVYPFILKPRKFVDDEKFIQALKNYPFTGKTLFIASVDFSHYTDEDFALLHDKKSFYVLNNSTEAKEYADLEADCPSCLYVVNSLARQGKRYPQLFLRDSSSRIAEKNLGINNTSRQFIYYTGTKVEDNGFTLAFFGDLIFDRQVEKTLFSRELIQNQFQTFFQSEDTTLSPSTYPHRKLFGIDFVGFNLETPVVSDPKFCQFSHKEVSFCSKNNILPYLSSLGFTMVTMANNHSLDGGIQAHLETVKELQANDIIPIGYIRSSTYFEKNYGYKTTIRGINVAREGFDFTITPRNLFDTYCKILKGNKNDGYINLVSVHRGLEYQTTHNASQESLAKQLIDCGADIIIGHHPHVVQDIGRYQGKPIIYSLGNFLFDMHLPNTETGAYVLIDYQSNDKKITIKTGAINATVK